MVLCFVASVAATLVNPYGWKVYQYVVLVSGRASGRNIDEWVPPGFSLFIGKLWVLSVLGVLVLFALPGRRPRALHICLVLCFLPLACGSVRMVAWWLLVSAPIVAELLAANLPPMGVTDAGDRQPTRMAGVFSAPAGARHGVQPPVAGPVQPFRAGVVRFSSN